MNVQFDKSDYALPTRFSELAARIKDLLNTRLWMGEFDFAVIALLCGVVIYYGLPIEPSIYLLSSVCIVVFLGLCLSFKLSNMWRTVALLIMFFMLGLTRSAWHTHMSTRPILPTYERTYMVEGWIEASPNTANRTRWLINITNIDGLDVLKTPEKVRISLRASEFKPGDFVRLRARLSAPPGPTVPHGYDPARRAFFEHIGGYGYAVGRPERFADPDLGGLHNIKRAWVRARHSLARKIEGASPQETAGLQIALMTGLRHEILPAQTESLREAGLAHILAISGLHMGLFAGSIYYVLSLGLACFTFISRRYDVRKAAAGLSLMAALYYLLISGASIATQRAFIMVAIIFAAVILNRRAFSLRSVSLAAALTIWLRPDAITGPGFQMSFAAALALIVVYRTWSDYKSKQLDPLPPDRTWLGRIKANLVGLSVTSLVAGTATTLFAGLHFNRIANYGFLGNLLAMPLFTLLVMPAAMIAYLAIPLGLGEVPLFVMSMGLQGVLYISDYVASLNGSMFYLASLPGIFKAFAGALFLGVCLGGLWTRVLSIIGLSGIFALTFIWSYPDLSILPGSNILLWDEENPDTLIVKYPRRDGYAQNQFSQMSGLDEPIRRAADKQDMTCDYTGCNIQIKDQNIHVINEPSALVESCQTADAIIYTGDNLGKIAKRTCNINIWHVAPDRHESALYLYVSPSKIRAVWAFGQSLPARPWSARS